MKIIYSGIRNENYTPGRSPSFEYSNFYLTLKDLPGADVVEYPYDPIVKAGKGKFNADLLELIRKEKPDVFFAFMFTDEFDVATLDEIRKLTTSVAWFADDHWKIYNYSRFYAPHFSRAVTTWSLAPEVYAKYGIKNVIRSQWACNTKLWKPLPLEKEVGVSFVGQRTASRAKLVNGLRRAGVDVYVRGWGWPQGRASQEEMVKLFSSSKINLNINDAPGLFSPRSLGRLVLRRSINKFVPSFDLVDNFKSWKDMSVPQIKARPFELAGCGALVISGMADDMGRYYAENKEMVFYKDVDDLIKKIKYYLKSEKEREEIAKAGYARTVAEHTYEKRLENIFTEIGL